MPTVEHHLEVIEAADAEDRPDAESLAAQLRSLGNDGWELVSVTFGVELKRFGRCHLLAFKRVSV